MAKKDKLIGRSTLLGRRLTYWGFGISPHPMNPNGWVQTTVYQFSQGFVICLSEGERPFDFDAAVSALGQETQGDEIYRFAQRLIEVKNPTKDFMDDFRITLQASMPGSQWRWF